VKNFEIGGQMGDKVVGTRLTLQVLRFEFWSNFTRGQRILTKLLSVLTGLVPMTLKFNFKKDSRLCDFKSQQLVNNDQFLKIRYLKRANTLKHSYLLRV
jgi:hypothetical protein